MSTHPRGSHTPPSRLMSEPNAPRNCVESTLEVVLSVTAGLEPWEIEALRLHYMGVRLAKVAKWTKHGIGELERVLASERGRAYLDAIRDHNAQILERGETELALLIPRAIEEVRRCLNSVVEENRIRAWKFILESQGFTPVRRVEIKRVRPGSEDDWAKMGEAELRDAAIAALTVETTAVPANDSGRSAVTPQITNERSQETEGPLEAPLDEKM